MTDKTAQAHRLAHELLLCFGDEFTEQQTRRLVQQARGAQEAARMTGTEHEKACEEAFELGMDDAILGRHDDQQWLRAARVIRAVHYYLPGHGEMGLREGMVLGKAVVAALDCNPPHVPAVATTGSDAK